MGAELNAGTGKETTSVYARVIDEHLPEAFDVMADMVFRPALDDIDSEREVILEEIAMYEDDPRRRCSTCSARPCSATHPLGPGDHRPRAGDRRHAGGRDRRASTPRATRPRTS